MTEDFIKRIEWTRAKNNRLWMDIMRLAFKHAPDEAKELLRQINENDRRVAELTARLAE